MRRLKYFSRKRPVTAQSSLALIAANAVSRRITETRAPKRARNSYIRDHEHPAERMHNAGYELITTAPRPRTAPQSRQPPRGHDRWQAAAARPAPITQTAKPVASSPTDLPRTCPTGKGAELVHVSRRGPRRPDRAASRAGTRPDSIDHPATRCDAASGMLPGTRRAANRLLRPLIPSPRSAASTFIRQLQLNTGSANGRHPGGTSQETGLRTRRHHQHHDPGAPDQPERHEPPDPVRSNAVNSRFHGVRQASGWLASCWPAHGWRWAGLHTDWRRAGRRTAGVWPAGIRLASGWPAGARLASGRLAGWRLAVEGF